MQVPTSFGCPAALLLGGPSDVAVLGLWRLTQEHDAGADLLGLTGALDGGAGAQIRHRLLAEGRRLDGRPGPRSKTLSQPDDLKGLRRLEA